MTARRPLDPRYKTRRWRRVSDAVLGKTRHNRTATARCQVVAGCPRPAQAADHIVPVFPGMPDSEFFGRHNLRPACHHHNVGRAFMADAGPAEAPRPRTIFNRRTR